MADQTTTAIATVAAVYLGERATKLMDVLLGEKAKSLMKHIDARFFAYWKCRNIEGILDRVDDLLKAEGVQPKPVPLSALVPIIEDAANVDDPTLAELYSRLLAAAAAHDEVANHPMFRESLRRMSGTDAQVLQIIVQMIMAKKTYDDHNRLDTGWLVDTASNRLSISKNAAFFSVENLRSMGVLEYDRERTFTSTGELVQLTMVGSALASLCVPEARDAAAK